jgi:hypothetical protein
VWAPDGREIAFSSQGGDAGHAPALYRRSSISVGGDTLLFKSDLFNEASLADDWSSDNKTIIFSRRPGPAAPAMNIWYITLPDGKPVPYLESQIVVQSFPDPNKAKRVVTQNGGTEPRWRRDGRELFYIARDGKLMAVPVIKSGETFEAGNETSLFQTPLSAGLVTTGFRYDVTSDGKRFLIISPNNAPDAAPPSAVDSTPITAVVNWTAALRKK